MPRRAPFKLNNWTLWRNCHSERTQVCWDMLTSCYYFCYNFIVLLFSFFFFFFFFFCFSVLCRLACFSYWKLITLIHPMNAGACKENMHADLLETINGRRRDVGLDTNFSYKRAKWKTRTKQHDSKSTRANTIIRICNKWWWWFKSCIGNIGLSFLSSLNHTSLSLKPKPW